MKNGRCIKELLSKIYSTTFVWILGRCCCCFWIRSNILEQCLKFSTQFRGTDRPGDPTKLQHCSLLFSSPKWLTKDGNKRRIKGPWWFVTEWMALSVVAVLPINNFVKSSSYFSHTWLFYSRGGAGEEDVYGNNMELCQTNRNLSSVVMIVIKVVELPHYGPLSGP